MSAPIDHAALQRVIDRAAIESLAGTYMRGLDRRDPVLLRSVFHDDASTHYGAFTGDPVEFAEMAMRALASHEANQHLIGQINLWFADEPAGDGVRRAAGEVYFQAFHRVRADNGDRTDLFIAGRYVDRYEWRAGHWGITHRTEIVDWARTEPTSDDYQPHRPHLVTGRHGHDDLSYRIHEA